jgi:Protein of unknown function (DUF1524)
MYRYEEDHAPRDFTNEQWHRIWEESASHSIEHIQPQQVGGRFVHRLGNLMLLPPGLNSSLSSKKPAEKLNEYRATGLYAASEVADTIEADGWKLTQVIEREKKILEGRSAGRLRCRDVPGGLLSFTMNNWRINGYRNNR